MTMSRDKKLALLVFSASALASAGIALYVAANKDGLRERLLEMKNGFMAESRSRMDGMTEEVAVKTAKLTHNPRINQEWVEHQWDMI